MSDVRRSIDLQTDGDPDPLFPRYGNTPLKPFTVVCALYDAGSGDMSAYHTSAPTAYEARIAVFQFILQETRTETLHYIRNCGWDGMVLPGHIVPERIFDDPLSVGGRVWFKDQTTLLRENILSLGVPQVVRERLLHGIDSAADFHESLANRADEMARDLNHRYEQITARRKAAQAELKQIQAAGNPNAVLDESWIEPREICPYIVSPARHYR